MEGISSKEKLVPILEWASSNMADAHEEAVSQVQSYTDAVSFFLEGEDKLKEKAQQKSASPKPSEQDTPPSPLSDSAVETKSSFDEDPSITLYKPRPTLKEIAATRNSFNQTLHPPDDGSVGIRRAASFGGYDNVRVKQSEKQESRSVSDVPSPDENCQAETVPGAGAEVAVTVKDKVMRRFTEREGIFQKYMDNVSLETSEKEASKEKKLPYINGDGLQSLSKLLCIMEKLAALKKENTMLRKKCVFLEDTKLLLNEQNKILSHRPVATIVKGESLISKAQSKMMHYLNTPGQGAPALSYTRHFSHNGDSGNAKEEMSRKTGSKSLESRPILKRSNSMGSVNELDIISNAAADSIPYAPVKPDNKDYHKETTVRQKVNKKLAKWTKMTKVFGRPEQTHKTESAAISVAEFQQVNRRSAASETQPATTAVVPPPKQINQKGESRIPVKTDYVNKSNNGACLSGPDSKVTGDSSGSGSDAKNGGFLIDQTMIPPKAELEDLNSLSDTEFDKELTASGSTLIRRNSSPTLSQSLQSSAEYIGEESGESMRRASSFKNRSTRRKISERSTGSYGQENLLSPEDARRDQSPRHSPTGNVDDMHTKAKAAWVKVKDIINTRKDSLKKKPSGRPRSMSLEQPKDSVEVSPEGSSWEDRVVSDGDTLEYEQAPRESPRLSRRHTARAEGIGMNWVGDGCYSSSRQRATSVKGDKFAPHAGRDTSRKESSVTPPVPTSLPPFLTGAVNEDFSKKMKEWEEKKKKGFTTKDLSTEENATKFSEDFIKRMEEWEKKKGLSESKIVSKEVATPTASSPPKPSPGAVMLDPAQPAQEQLSESFSKTVQEWERIREKRAKDPPFGDNVGRVLMTRKTERSKSRDRKDRTKFDKELQKLERKEKLIEKERQKLEKMRYKLETEGKVDTDFFQKLQEWEVLKTIKPVGDSSKKFERGVDEHHSRSSSEKSRHEKTRRHSTAVSRERLQSDGSLTDTMREDEIELQQPESPASPLVDEGTSIDLNLTMEAIALLEETTQKLTAELEEKDEELLFVQEELKQMTEHMNQLNEEYNQKIKEYKKEIWTFSRLGQFTNEAKKFEGSINSLKEKINEFQESEEKILAEKKSVDERILEELTLHSQKEALLVQEIQKLQTALDRKAYVRGSEVFEKLYNYVSNIHVQVSSLQRGVIERNKELDDLQRHLLASEVSNRLLVAELSRQTNAVNFLREQRKVGMLRRWKTFHGNDLCIREDGSIHLKKSSPDLGIKKLPHTLKELSRQNVEKSLLDVSSGLALPFDWLDGIKRQIQEVQETQSSEKSCQTQPSNISETGCQTVVALSNFPLPLVRMNWDTGHAIPVVERGIQHSVATADAAVFIEDLEVYESKQRGKRRFAQLHGTNKFDKPKTGTVHKRMELFDPKLREKDKHELHPEEKSHWTIFGQDKQKSSGKNDQFVVGKKILDCEQKENEARDDVYVEPEKQVGENQPISGEGFQKEVSNMIPNASPKDKRQLQSMENIASNTNISPNKKLETSGEAGESDISNLIVKSVSKPVAVEAQVTGKPPQPPSSPIFRSRNLRRLRTGGVRVMSESRRPSADRIMLAVRRNSDRLVLRPRTNSEGACLDRKVLNGAEFIPAEAKADQSFLTKDDSKQTVIPLGKPFIVNAIPKLKTIEELLQGCSHPTLFRKRSYSMPKSQAKRSREISSTSPRSLPCIKPKEGTPDLIYPTAMSKMLDIPTPTTSSTTTRSTSERSLSQQPFKAVKRKAFVLETFTFDTFKGRPHSDHIERETSESLWHRLKPRSSTLQSPAAKSTAPSRTAKEYRSYRKIFSKRRKDSTPRQSSGAVSALCMQAITLETDDGNHDNKATMQECTQPNENKKKGSRLNRMLDSRIFAKPMKFFSSSK